MSTKVETPPSFARSLFFGDVDETQAFPFPELPAEDRDTMELLVRQVEQFMEARVDSRRIDHDASISREVLDELKGLGLFGLQIPEEHGGLGLGNTAYARIFEAVAARDASIAVTLGAHQSIGLKGILLFGNAEQRRRYLPKLASGEWVAAFCLTEPTSGSDAASIRTRATPTADGKGFVLDGGKIWITNGGFADVFTVFAQTPVPGPDGKTLDRITAFVVERGFGGVTSGKEEDKLGIKGSSTTAVYFENTPVPRENVLGEVGGGFKVAMTVLNNGRFGLAAGTVGAMKRAIARAAEHARTREQFGKKLAEFGAIKDKFAKMATVTYAAESMVYLTCGMMDRGAADYALEAAMCKIFASEAGWVCINEALQVMGGLGYMKELPFERQLRDARISTIFEGTNEILRLFVALSGLQAPGEHLRELSQAIRDPVQNYGMLVSEIVERVRQRIGGETVEKAHEAVRRSADKLERQVVAFAQAVDGLLRRHGKKVIDEQVLLSRVADAAIDLFAMTAVISRSTRSLDRGDPRADHEGRLCNAFCDDANRRIRRNLRGLEKGKPGDERLARLADELFEAEGRLPPHPTGVLG